MPLRLRQPCNSYCSELQYVLLRKAYGRHFKFDAIKPFQNSNKVFEDTLVPSKNPNCITIATLWQKCLDMMSNILLKTLVKKLVHSFKTQNGCLDVVS